MIELSGPLLDRACHLAIRAEEKQLINKLGRIDTVVWIRATEFRQVTPMYEHLVSLLADDRNVRVGIDTVRHQSHAITFARHDFR